MLTLCLFVKSVLGGRGGGVSGFFLVEKLFIFNPARRRTANFKFDHMSYSLYRTVLEVNYYFTLSPPEIIIFYFKNNPILEIEWWPHIFSTITYASKNVRGKNVTSMSVVYWAVPPIKHDTSTQCWTNPGPPSTTSAHHWSNIW